MATEPLPGLLMSRVIRRVVHVTPPAFLWRAGRRRPIAHILHHLRADRLRRIDLTALSHWPLRLWGGRPRSAPGATAFAGGVGGAGAAGVFALGLTAGFAAGGAGA